MTYKIKLICPECGNEIEITGDANVKFYGHIKPYRCPKCRYFGKFKKKYG